ncbi:hypothetical protein [Vibrio mediterranei]|uniref:hypothetical protein n=1 Tax=Vibrio mediterranei TaxID=689 RepID=UPI00148CBB99|nr:hypothetical protein [Vibrio mediterranei]NOH30562.1 hypothetical protein [Vibrio mediterranei]
MHEKMLIRDLNAFYRNVIVKTAYELGLENVDFKSSVELTLEIEQVSRDIYFKLDDFICAYEDWFEQYLHCRNGSQNINSLNIDSSLQEAEQVLNEVRLQLINSLREIRVLLSKGSHQ